MVGAREVRPGGEGGAGGGEGGERREGVVGGEGAVEVEEEEEAERHFCGVGGRQVGVEERGGRRGAAGWVGDDRLGRCWSLGGRGRRRSGSGSSRWGMVRLG